MVEYNEAFVTKANAAEQKENLSRERGSQQKALVAAMAESTVLGDIKTVELTKSCGYFKMKKIENLKAKTPEKLIKNLIDTYSVLQQTYESTTYSKFEDFISVH